MFDKITLHGGTASLIWGHRAAVVLRAWTITRQDGKWTLSGVVVRSDTFQCRRAVALKELRFTAPRDKGRWYWEVLDVDLGTNALTATLGQPLQ